MRRCGTRARYVVEKCRCRKCRQANTNYQTALDHEKRPPMVVRHLNGSKVTAAEGRCLVVHRGTRDVVARGHDREAAFELRDWINAAYRAPAVRWAPEWMPRRIREHLAELAAAGISLKQASRLARVARSRMVEISRGAKRIHVGVGRRILAVQPVGTTAAPGAFVPAEETWALIGELRAYGWTKTELGRLLGSRARVPSLQVGREQVLGRTAVKVAKLHDELWARDPRFRAVCSWECMEKMAARRESAQSKESQ